MKLIKCIYCGRPFYNDQQQCPFCGNDAKTSANNFVTRPISDASSHKKMEDALSARLHNGADNDNQEIHDTTAEAMPTEAAAHEPLTTDAPEHETTNVDMEDETSKETADNLDETKAEMDNNTCVKPERADAMAALKKEEGDMEDEEDAEPSDADNVETTNAPRKRHTWLWILIVLIAVLAVFVFWQWDFIQEKTNSILG